MLRFTQQGLPAGKGMAPMTTATMSTPAARTEGREEFLGSHDRYVARTALILTLYAMLFFVLAFLSPYVVPALTLLTDGSLADQKAAADQLLFLNETVGTAIPVFFFGSLLFGLLLTKRVAGPLAHLQRCAKEWGDGYVAQRVNFLPADRLDGLGAATNHAWAQVEQALRSIHQQNQDIRRIADSLAVTLASQPVGSPEIVERLRQMADASSAIRTSLQPFHLIQRRGS